MAASSSSSSWEHDVFLCFRGEDTREGLISHLYQALSVHYGIDTFMDARLPSGREISEVLAMIERSRILVVVFSPNFATSKWCLDELMKIIERSKDRNAGHEVLPVFYKVDPTELRGPKGKTAEHLMKVEDDPDKVERWRLALEELSYLKGLTFMQGMESGLIREIVQEVRSRLDCVSLRGFHIERSVHTMSQSRSKLASRSIKNYLLMSALLVKKRFGCCCYGVAIDENKEVWLPKGYLLG